MESYILLTPLLLISYTPAKKKKKQFSREVSNRPLKRKKYVLERFLATRGVNEKTVGHKMDRKYANTVLRSTNTYDVEIRNKI